MHDDFLSSSKITSVTCYSLQSLLMTHPKYGNVKTHSVSSCGGIKITCPYVSSYLILNRKIPAIINWRGNIPNPFKYSKILSSAYSNVILLSIHPLYNPDSV